MYKDNIKCNFCGFNGLVEIGAEVCPECGEEGGLSWIEGEDKEIEI